MCYIVFSVVCLVCSVVVFCVVIQNKEDTAECGPGRKLRSHEPEALPAFKCK